MSKEEQNIELPNEAVKPVEESVQPVQQTVPEQSVQQSVPGQPVQEVQSVPEVQSVQVAPEQPTEASQPVQTEQPVQQVPVQQSFPEGQVYVSSSQPATQPVVNTEAAKAKASELADKAKQGFGNYTEKLKTDKKVLGATIAVIVVAVLLICGVYLNGGSKGVVKSFAQAYVKSDAKKITKLMHKDYLDTYEDMGFDLEETLEDTFDDYDDEDYKVLSYEIIDSEKLEKKDLKDLAEDLEDNCDIDEDTVKAAVVYTIKFKVDDDGDKDTMKTEVTAVKIKGKWYIFLGDLS
ncbi:MAG: hypothetical protein K2H20_03415, partial [Bacilli bacterium]|nr:hypothetical protein [Bacilli bacterium]